jgi:hypothetical protein
VIASGEIRLIVRGDDFGMSLTGADGTFRPSVELAQQHVQYDDAVSELLA